MFNSRRKNKYKLIYWSESYSFTTVSLYIKDWKNIYSFDYRICQEYIKEKLNEQKYINTIEEMMFISSKFTDKLYLCLFNDYMIMIIFLIQIKHYKLFWD